MAKKRRDWLIPLIIVVAVIALLAVFLPIPPQKTIKIGFIGPLTGDAAIVGKNELNAINLALGDLENKISIKIQIIAEDGKCNGQDAATAAQKLVNIDKVKIILGGICSAETLSAAPIAETNKVILFSSFSTSPDITKAGDYIFRNAYSDEIFGIKAAEMVKEKKIAMITENSDYSIGLREVFKREFVKLGGAIVSDEIYAPNEKDFRTYLTKIKASNSEAIFINPATSASGAGMIAKQIKELGINVPLYSNFIIWGKDSLDAAGGALEGATFFDAPILNPNNAGTNDFISRYTLKYGAPYNEFEVGARYDSVLILVGALEKCKENTDCIKNYLYAMKSYNGTIGTYSFDKNGDAVGLIAVIKKIVNGQSVLQSE